MAAKKRGNRNIEKSLPQRPRHAGPSRGWARQDNSVNRSQLGSVAVSQGGGSDGGLKKDYSSGGNKSVDFQPISKV